MPIIVSIIFLISAAWLSSQIALFIPLNIFYGVQNIFWYIFLGFLVIAVSWLIGE
jgi:hypothetical protein